MVFELLWKISKKYNPPFISKLCIAMNIKQLGLIDIYVNIIERI